MMQRFVFAISVLLLFTLKVSAQNFADSKLIEDSEKEVVKQILTNARVGTISNDSVSAITPSKRVLEGSENIVRFSSRERRDHALFFVVKDYDNWKNLEYPIDDAEKIAVLLKDKYNFDTTIIRNPTLTEIESTLEKYSLETYQEYDQLLIWFGGHGSFDTLSKEGYFIPKDGDNQSSKEWLSYSNLRTILNETNCNHILFSIDACYAGTFDQVTAMRGEEIKGIPLSSHGNSRSQIESELVLRSRLFVASGKKEVVPDESEFADKFKYALEEEDGRDGILTFIELLAELSNKYSQEKPKSHFATFAGNEEGSNFLFVGENPALILPKLSPTKKEGWLVTQFAEHPVTFSTTIVGIASISYGFAKHYLQATPIYNSYKSHTTETDFINQFPEYNSRREAYNDAESKRKVAGGFIIGGAVLGIVGITLSKLEKKNRQNTSTGFFENISIEIGSSTNQEPLGLAVSYTF